MLVRDMYENESKHNTKLCFPNCSISTEKDSDRQTVGNKFCYVVAMASFCASRRAHTVYDTVGRRCPRSAAPRSAALHCAALRCPTLGCTPAALRSATLRCATLQCGTRRYVALRFAALRSAAPHAATLCCAPPRPPYNTKNNAVREAHHSLFSIIKESRGGTC